MYRLRIQTGHILLAAMLLLSTLSLVGPGHLQTSCFAVEPRTRASVAANQRSLVLRQRAVTALTSARGTFARNPSDSARRLLTEGERLIRLGGDQLPAGSHAAARVSFQQAEQVLAGIRTRIGAAASPAQPTAAAEAAATLRRRQEETDRRRFVQAEELLHRVRTSVTQSQNRDLRRQFERMQDNMLRVRREFSTSPTARFTNNLTPGVSSQVRPLLEETIQLGQRALLTFEGQRRIERSLDQTRGRVQRARQQVRGSSNPEIQTLLDQADVKVRQSGIAGDRGDVAQAKALLAAAEDSVARAVELSRAEDSSGTVATSQKVGEAARQGRTSEARAGLESVGAHLQTARRRLGTTTDPIAARLLLVAEDSFLRAQNLFRQGQMTQCLSTLKLVGRLLKDAYVRDSRG